MDTDEVYWVPELHLFQFMFRDLNKLSESMLQ